MDKGWSSVEIFWLIACISYSRHHQHHTEILFGAISNLKSNSKCSANSHLQGTCSRDGGVNMKMLSAAMELEDINE